MKRFYILLASVVALAFFVGSGDRTSAHNQELQRDANLISTTVVISQVYGGGGATAGSATYKYDYVELKNISASPQSLNGLSLMYGSATGNFSSNTSSQPFPLPNVTLQPGQYFFVQAGSAGTVGGDFPVTPDAVTTAFNMSSSSGKMALTNGLASNTCGATATRPTTSRRPSNVARPTSTPAPTGT